MSDSHFYFIEMISCLCLVLAFTSNAYTQISDKDTMKDLEIKHDSISISSILMNRIKDSLLKIEYNEFKALDTGSVNKSDNFYLNLHQKAKSNKVTSELYLLLFNKPKPTTTKSSKQAEPQTQSISTAQEVMYQCLEGKIIRNISIVRLNPFGEYVEDLDKKAGKTYQKVGNSIHILSKERIVRKNLLFRPYDIFSAKDMEDTERLLRSLPFIKEASIRTVETEGAYVDLQVVVKDQWSMGGDADPESLTEFAGSLYDYNFLGWGHRITASLYYDQETKPRVGYRFDYEVNNIKGTFVDLDLSYKSTFNQEFLIGRLQKNFINPSDKYAGGLRAGIIHDPIPSFQSPSTIQTTFVERKYRFYDFWYAHALKIQNNSQGMRKRVDLATSFYHQNYMLRPENVTADTLVTYHDKHIFLAEISISKQQYVKSNLIYGFGRTEDIPTGYRYSLTGGVELGEFGERPYVQGKAMIGGFVKGIGYLRGSLGMDTFLRDGKGEQAMLTAGVNYFSNLKHLGKYSLRLFADAYYIQGFNRMQEELIRLNSNGITGLDYNNLSGVKRLYLNTQAVAFTPWYFYGFRFAFFTYADMGYLDHSQTTLFTDQNALYSFGGGFRVRNENLVFNTLEFKLGYLPRTIEGQSPVFYSFGATFRLNLRDFRTRKPQVLGFR